MSVVFAYTLRPMVILGCSAVIGHYVLWIAVSAAMAEPISVSALKTAIWVVGICSIFIAVCLRTGFRARRGQIESVAPSLARATPYLIGIGLAFGMLLGTVDGIIHANNAPRFCVCIGPASSETEPSVQSEGAVMGRRHE